jgi:hypothetical protein
MSADQLGDLEIAARRPRPDAGRDVFDIASDPIMTLKELMDHPHVLHHPRVHHLPTAHHPVGQTVHHPVAVAACRQ